ncbi:MAG: sugar phosphorylase [Egibacteraceae bacterium]
MPTLDDRTRKRLRAHLRVLYGPGVAEATAGRLETLLTRHLPAPPGPEGAPFDETDVVLISYADQIRDPAMPPLAGLHRFLSTYVGEAISSVHLLPFFPATSDDGFAVRFYEVVDPAVGQWRDIVRLGADYKLVFDAVVNHTSASNPWFVRFLRDDPAFGGFYRTADPEADTDSVTRPRTSPLLTPFAKANGDVAWVWTTFSPDQVDLDYGNPEVLLAVTELLLTYVGYGARTLRLDAIAYLWKRLSTSCIHLPETHEVIRLWRTVLDLVAPGTLVLTETNVPHAENVSYFGNGDDEAHLVYQFPLAPLVLSAFHLADTTTLQEWAAGLSVPSSSTSYLNFLGSHDGVGLRPAEGLLTPAEISQLCDLARAHGGGVSYKTDASGDLSPYELNTVYFDALTELDSAEPQHTQVARFLSAQSILLALPGVPAIYMQGLLGMRNWLEGVERTGRLRSINRRKFELAELESVLSDTDSLQHEVFFALLDRINVRTHERCFHPNGEQRLLATDGNVLAFERWDPCGSAKVICLHSVTGRPQTLALCPEDGLTARGQLVDLCGGPPCAVDDDGTLHVGVPGYGVRWLRTATPD